MSIKLFYIVSLFAFDSSLKKQANNKYSNQRQGFQVDFYYQASNTSTHAYVGFVLNLSAVALHPGTIPVMTFDNCSSFSHH